MADCHDNYVLKADGDNAIPDIQDSVIYDDGTNVGIGTANPDESLHIYGGQKNLALGSGDAYPMLQILNYSHDNVSINFD